MLHQLPAAQNGFGIKLVTRFLGAIQKVENSL